jgi:enoyl-CoA hydratase/carnithine racemase
VSAPTTFRMEERGPLVWITLNRPEKRNALTFETYRELTDTFRGLADHPRARGVVVTGAGPAFCTGGDVHEIIGKLLGRTPAELLAFTRATCALVASMRALPLPVIASLNGQVAGAGAAIAVAADFRVASREARIAFLFVKVGLSGADMGVAHLLPRIVGLGRASELLMRGEFIDADEAWRIGLYNRVVPRERLEEETLAFAEPLVRGPKRGIAETKKALEVEGNMDLANALALEARIQATLMAEPDFHEGFKAFAEKRPTRFRGAPE